MRRRRQKNTLLPKMLGLAVLINAILLPILARFGAFKNIAGGQKIIPIEIIKLPPVPPKPKEQAKKAVKKQIAKARTHSSTPKAASRAVSTHHAAPGPPPVKVVGVSGSGQANGGGDSNITTPGPGNGAVTKPVVSPPVTPPVVTPDPGPTQINTPAPVTPPVPTPPRQTVITDAEPIAQPQPTVPDDLNYDDIHGDFRALFTIHSDGSAEVKMVSSTGNSRLDQLALESAQRWKFRPATVDGKPVESFRRFVIQFYPS